MTCSPVIRDISLLGETLMSTEMRPYSVMQRTCDSAALLTRPHFRAA